MDARYQPAQQHISLLGDFERMLVLGPTNRDTEHVTGTLALHCYSFFHCQILCHCQFFIFSMAPV